MGAFAHLIRTTRPRWSVDLNEVNPQSVDIARNFLGLNVVDLDVGKLTKNGRYDVVSSISVVEHIPDPVSFIRSYARLVAVGGWMVIAVPHFTRLNALISRGSNANVVPPYHVSLFNEDALRRALNRVHGLHVEIIIQAGPPAFSLVDHVQFGDNWDIVTPTAERPVPTSILIEPYDEKTSAALNRLGEASSGLEKFFAETDGRLYLIAYCRRTI